MKNYNLAVLEGRLVKDPTLSLSKNGNQVVKFCIAVNGHGCEIGKGGNPELVSFLDIISWNLDSNSLEKLKKGCLVQVVGHLSQWRWQDDAGKHHSRVSIKAIHVDFPFVKKTQKYI
jgi:single-strand DNA-binding protein